MKKNKLLLSLGSLSIFSAIPFVALLNVIIQKLKIIIIVYIERTWNYWSWNNWKRKC
nr:variable surface lipoprotein [Mycoplasmopsis bovis]